MIWSGIMILIVIMIGIAIVYDFDCYFDCVYHFSEKGEDKPTPLIRIRNPHGTEFEWNGAW